MPRYPYWLHSNGQVAWTARGTRLHRLKYPKPPKRKPIIRKGLRA